MLVYAIDCCKRTSELITLSGWARTRQGTPLASLTLESDDHLAISISCHQPRPDVAATHGGDPNCGFTYFGPAPAEPLQLVATTLDGQHQAILKLPAPSQQQVSPLVLYRHYLQRAWHHLRTGNWGHLLSRARTLLTSARPLPAPNRLAQQARCQALLVIDHGFGGGAGRYLSEHLLRHLPPTASHWRLTFNPLQLCYHLAEYPTPHSIEPSKRWRLHWPQVQALLTAPILPPLFYNNAVGYPHLLPLLAALTAYKEAHPDWPLTIALHDQFFLCPSPHLIGEMGHYCGLPSVEECQRCLATNNEPYLALYRRHPIIAWRQSWQQLITQADTIYLFSPFMYELLTSQIPAVDPRRIHLAPHPIPPLTHEERNRWHYYRANRSRRTPGQSGRIVIAGAITHTAKGNRLAARLIETAHRRHLPLTWHIVGQLTPPPDAPHTQTGPYQPEQLTELLIASDPDLLLFPSVAPETFSYLLHELARYQLPIALYPIGAQSDFLACYPQAIPLPWPPDAETTLHTLLNHLDLSEP